MRQISYSAEVFAPFETIWQLMLYRIEHPQGYLPGSEDARIIERHDDFLVREVTARGIAITERVTIDREKREIRYMPMEHPLFSGTVTQRAVPASRQSPVSPVLLTMVVDWAPKDEEAERIIVENMPSEIQQEVLSLKDEAEELAKE